MANDSTHPSPAIEYATATGRSSMHRDLTAAYFAAGARIGAWAIVSSIVYRLAGPAQFATLALIRGTIGILNYTSVGLAPALIHLFAQNDRVRSNERSVFSTGVFVALVSTIAGLLIALMYAKYFEHFDRLHVVPPSLVHAAPIAVILIGVGTLLRLFSDTAGALLQTRGRIALDNILLASGDIFWALTTVALFRRAGLLTASITYAMAAMVVLIGRSLAVASLDATPFPPRFREFRWNIARVLLSFGSFVLLAQLAEYFYAPTDYILINHFFGLADIAAYAPGVQIDLGLLMLVTGVAAVLLPKSALAHAADSPQTLRRYYIRGTLASTALLLLAAIGVWILYPLIFRILFGPHPPNTRSILDLVLIGTVVGGSSAVGRSVLIGMGKIKPFTLAAIIAGAVNVIASFCFAKYTPLGLRGILYGTLIAVVGRCAIWMPWYVMRVLRAEVAIESARTRISSGPGIATDD